MCLKLSSVPFSLKAIGSQDDMISRIIRKVRQKYGGGLNEEVTRGY